MNLKPHKKVFATAFFLLVFLGGVFAYAQKNSSPRETQNLVVTAGAAGESDEWKKTLSTIGASANTSEGFLFASSSAYDATIPETPENLSNTDVLGRKLFLAYAELSKSGELTPENTQKIAQNLANTAVASSTLQTQQYSLSDLSIVSESSANLATYRTQLGATLAKHSFPELGRELQAIEKALQTKNSDDLALTLRAAKAYRSIAKALLPIPVPENLAQVHLNIVNSYALLAASSQTMSEILADPLPALSAIQAYQTAAAILLAGLETKVSQ